jgi:CheY-like chemotaxis protein/predicted regulator of Ras-like GTPase activity (Roadblock/LC7/MglB family)
MMSDVWRICIVEDNALNENLVNALRKDGYEVQGVTGDADAINILWSEEFDVLIYDLQAPEAGSLEVLQWLHAYRPAIHLITIGPPNLPALHAQALESGAVSYLEKPLDLRILKDELRRLSQHSGFTASLDSFDLLDIIQIINMSRKNIGLLINTGLEEQGALGFQQGELTWAEYGLLRGEEAFFALAAHKNGTVTQQLLNEQVHANVTQPLSRLIFQALQYRTKYANSQQYKEELEEFSSNTIAPFSLEDIDDRPFNFSSQEEQTPAQTALIHGLPDDLLLSSAHFEVADLTQTNGAMKEWWQHTGPMEHVHKNGVSSLNGSASPLSSLDTLLNGTEKAKPPHESAIPTHSTVSLPSWLTDQPTSQNLPAVQPPTVSNSQLSTPPSMASLPIEWPSTHKTTDDLSPQWSELLQQTPVDEPKASLSPSPPWQSAAPPPTPVLWPSEVVEQPDLLLTSSIGNGAHGKLNGSVADTNAHTSGPSDPLQDSNPALSTSSLKALRLAAKHNYPALVSALQTLGYSIVGFMAAAIVSIDGHPVAQVAVNDLNISKLCRCFSTIQKNAMQALDHTEGDDYEEAVITSSKSRILMRIVDTDRKAFLVLMTTREASATESLQMMANVQDAISAALR